MESLKNTHEPTREKLSAPGEISPAFETVNADYLSPRRQANNNLHYQKRMDKQVAQYFRPIPNRAAAMRKQDMKSARPSQKNSEQRSLATNNAAVKQKTSEEINTALIFKASRSAVSPDNVPKPIYYKPPGPAETVAIHETASNHNPADRQSGESECSDSKFHRQTPFDSSTHEISEKMQQEKMHLATVKKNSNICRLISETKKSLFSENDSRTESLLNALNAYKGQDDAYVMKLRAFWYLKQGKHESAKPILDLLLQKDENDLEAGINMAVLEIRTNRLGQAQARLEKLRRIYADNIQILSLLRKIKR